MDSLEYDSMLEERRCVQERANRLKALVRDLETISSSLSDCLQIAHQPSLSASSFIHAAQNLVDLELSQAEDELRYLERIMD